VTTLSQQKANINLQFGPKGNLKQRKLALWLKRASPMALWLKKHHQWRYGLDSITNAI